MKQKCKLHSEKWKTKKKSFIGSATGPIITHHNTFKNIIIFFILLLCYILFKLNLLNKKEKQKGVRECQKMLITLIASKNGDLFF